MRRLLLFIMVGLLSWATSSAQQADSKRKSMEDAFIEQMKETAKMDVLSRITNDTTVMSRVEGKSYYVHPGDTYIVDGISTATYYERKGKHFIPLCDVKYPKETIANRLLLPNRELPDGNINMKFQKSDSLSIQFKQLMTFCRNKGYDMFVGVESMSKKEMKVDLFLFNNENKWLHVINLSCPIKNVADKGLIVDGTAWLFIPTSNIRQLMGKELPKDFMDIYGITSMRECFCARSIFPFY